MKSMLGFSPYKSMGRTPLSDSPFPQPNRPLLDRENSVDRSLFANGLRSDLEGRPCRNTSNASRLGGVHSKSWLRTIKVELCIRGLIAGVDQCAQLYMQPFCHSRSNLAGFDERIFGSLCLQCLPVTKAPINATALVGPRCNRHANCFGRKLRRNAHLPRLSQYKLLPRPLLGLFLLVKSLFRSTPWLELSIGWSSTPALCSASRIPCDSFPPSPVTVCASEP